MTQWVIFGGLTVLALAHSWLGEKDILQPLLADERWETDIPRRAMEVILRFAWHLTSIAWMGLAAIVVQIDVALAVGTTALLSAITIFVSLRGHLAWPLFALVAFAAFLSGGWVADAVLDALVLTAGGLSVGLAGLHVYWAFGGTWKFADVLPQRKDGSPAFQPGVAACLGVASLLLAFAALLWLALTAPSSWTTTTALAVAFGVLVLRAIGDTKQVGFSKSDRSTRFALEDDRVYTPVVVIMAFGAGIALFVV